MKFETVLNLMEKNKNSVSISYIDSNGYPVTKAMLAPRKTEGAKYIYFSTNMSSNKVSAYLNNNKGSVYFLDKRFFRGLSLIGTVEIIKDLEIKKEIWNDGDEIYYKEGVEDPDYCVLKFTISHGRFYSAFKNNDFQVEE